MKAKKIFPILALILCLGSFGGCTTPDQKIAFGNYWNENAVDTLETIKETLVYDVQFEKASGMDSVDYQLSYSNGKYTTVLEKVTENDESIYVYKTELNITATYTLGTAAPAVCEDSVKTETRFYAAKNNLRPISSTKKIISNSPASGMGHTKVEDCFQTFNVETTTEYDASGASGKATVISIDKDGKSVTEDNAFEIDQKKFSYLDNEQLLCALRAIPNSTTSAKVLVYSPFAEAVQKVSLSFSSEASAEFSFYQNGSEEKVKSTITYRPVSIVLDEKNPGGTQTAWIAKATDTTNNKYRNVMLYLETPLSYGMGSLQYKLLSVNYQ